MSVLLKNSQRKQEIEKYNKEVYSQKWFTGAAQRLVTDYYSHDHYSDTLKTLAAHQGKKVLECGIGTGEYFAINLAKKGKSVYGVDFSRSLVQNCCERFANENILLRVCLGNVQKLPFKNASFDISYAIGVLPYVTSPSDFISEMHRVTKKNGLIIFDVMNLWHSSQFINYIYCALESTRLGFSFIELLKSFKKIVGLKTHKKKTRDLLNYRLINHLEIKRILKSLKLKFQVKGYNVLLPLNMPIIGKRGNICKHSHLFSYRLKDNKFLKYFGSKLVYIIET